MENRCCFDEIDRCLVARAFCELVECKCGHKAPLNDVLCSPAERENEFPKPRLRTLLPSCSAASENRIHRKHGTSAWLQQVAERTLKKSLGIQTDHWLRSMYSEVIIFSFRQLDRNRKEAEVDVVSVSTIPLGSRPLTDNLPSTSLGRRKYGVLNSSEFPIFRELK